MPTKEVWEDRLKTLEKDLPVLEIMPWNDKLKEFTEELTDANKSLASWSWSIRGDFDLDDESRALFQDKIVSLRLDILFALIEVSLRT